MTNIIWGSLMIVCMIINLTRIPYTIREEKYNSTAFSIALLLPADKTTTTPKDTNHAS